MPTNTTLIFDSLGRPLFSFCETTGRLNTNPQGTLYDQRDGEEGA